MLLEALLSAALEAGFGLIAEAGFGDTLRDLKARLTSTTERQRREALERAFARASEAVGDDPIKPLLEHRPFLEELVKALLDPKSGFDVEAVGEVWQERLPQHDRALRQFFTHLETTLFADPTWGPILERFQTVRHQPDVVQALQTRNLDVPAQKVVREVSLRLSGSGGLAAEGGVAAGAGGVAVGGNVGQIVLQQFIMQSGARADSADLRQRYLSRLRLRCCNLPLDALGGEVDSQKRVTLDQVYIDLHTDTMLPANLLEQIQQGAFAAWVVVENALHATSGGSAREETGLDRGVGGPDSARRPLPALDALRLSPYITFLGDPGAGKSTLVRMVITQVIDGTPPPGVSPELLPVLVVLRDLAQRLASLDLDALPGDRHADTLAAAVRDQMIADLAGLEAEGFAADLREALTAQRCFLVCDGLDEVPAESRGLVRRAVRAAVERYQPPRVIVTCRTRAYLGDAILPGFNAFRLMPFDAEEIATFARAWYNAQHQLGRVDAVQVEQKAANLTEAALKPGLRELSSNPMLLTTMAVIHQQETRLPEERVALYDKAVTILLHRWEREKVSNDVLAALPGDARRLRQIMERLAYEAHRTARQGSPGEAADLPRHIAQDIIEDDLGDANQAHAFLNYVDQRAGLLIGQPGASGRPDTYTFPHRTFQEYLAGCYLLTGSDRDRAERFYSCAAEGDRWSLVAQLGAEELFYNNVRNGAGELFYLADELLELEADLPTPQVRRAALWSGQMAMITGGDWITRGPRTPRRGQAYRQRLLPHMVTLLASDLTAPERCQAGQVLGQLGDTRFLADAWYLPAVPLLGFVEIPAGPFQMGSDKGRDPEAFEWEFTQHEISLPAYYIARYPVTVAQFHAFVEDSGQRPGDDRSVHGPLNHPVVHITWYEAIQYGRWLTERLRGWESTPEPLATLLRSASWQASLPSEAQWEKAARGSDGRIYPWGNEPDTNRANYVNTGIGTTCAVGCFPGGASPYGIEDMSGNVWEWTRSLYENYPYPTGQSERARRENLEADRDTRRVLRGGAFNGNSGDVRCAYRLGDFPGLRLNDIGFRVVVLPGL